MRKRIDRIVAVLLRIYPPSWRKEYGPELGHVLESKPLDTKTLVNVGWHGAWQRIRLAEPWMMFGVPMMLVVTAIFALMIVAPPAYDPQFDFSSGPRFGWVLFDLWLTIGCGFWTVYRKGGTLPHAGVQTMKMALLINVPHFIAYALIATGALGVIVLGPGDVPTTIFEHGFAISFHDANRVAPSLLFLMAIRIPGILECWLWGAVGGGLGRLVARRRLAA